MLQVLASGTQGYSVHKDGTWHKMTDDSNWVTAEDIARFTAERDKLLGLPTTDQMLTYAAHWSQRHHPQGALVLGRPSDRCSVCGMPVAVHPWHDMAKAHRALCTGERVKV
jgi:hypothetical protein